MDYVEFLMIMRRWVEWKQKKQVSLKMLTDKVNILSNDMAEIKTIMKENDKWSEKFKIPIIVGLIVAVANNLPAIIKLFKP